MTWPRSPLFLLLISSISLLLAETSSDPSRPRNRDSGSRDKDSDVRSLMGGSEMSYKDEEIRPDIRDADSEAADRHSEIRHRDSDIRDADSDIRLEIRDQESRIRHRDPDIRSEIRDKDSRIRHRDSRSRGIDEDITSSGRTFFPQGAIPPPGKGRSNISSSHGHVARHHHHHQQQQQQMLAHGLPGGPSVHDRDAERQVLASSHEALFVTERRYLRRDWCKSQPLRQTVRERGCVPRTVINRFCYGQCNSFYIPRRATADDDDEGGEGGEGEGDDRGGGDEGGDDDEVLGAPSDSKDLHGGGGGGDDEGIAEAAAAAGAGGAQGRTARKSSSSAATAGTSTSAGSRVRSSSAAGGKGAAAAAARGRSSSSSSSSSGGAGGRGRAGSARRGAASFRACAACRPQRFSSLTVELSCPGLEPPVRRVRLSRVKHCRCVSVRVHD
ncbi:golgin subfamily A member 6-like protein 2 isoform X2 [Lethenteron reissneri]|uniref:golgin subfamily A member 6-like protein 2 isoform X2 n=1 Tax=Lethenteron reissneri TaxID=7753 RepID=UPI002AB7AE00|nr:golgin subfamily A member 6-like protein 2 isoform X2 [Lethenteron reissneri]